MLGAAHSMANPLTAMYGTIHGVAVGLALPWVMKFNAEESECRNIYADFAKVAGIAKMDCSDEDGSNILIKGLKNFDLAKLSTYHNNMNFEIAAIPELFLSRLQTMDGGI